MTVRRARLLCAVQSIALVVAAASAVAWAASVGWTVFAMGPFGGSAGIKCGVVFYNWTTEPLRRSLTASGVAPFGWSWDLSERIPPMEWWPFLSVRHPSGRGLITVPLWMPALLAGSAGFACWRQRRSIAAVGHCGKCGYDRAGLANGAPCPECGAGTKP
jgi:hypothetical protein